MEFGDTEVPVELAQRTNPQCSESSAKAHPLETLMALFYKAPALYHSAGKRCMLDLPLAKRRPAREQGQDLILPTRRSFQLREVSHFSPGAPWRSRTPCVVLGKNGGVQRQPWDLGCCLLSSEFQCPQASQLRKSKLT